jgi:hypothetical protein
MRLHPPTQEVELRVPSAWSCSHGIARWSQGCECTEGDSSWKPTLRRALDNLGVQVDALFEQHTAATLQDPWEARNGYLPVRNGWESVESFWNRSGKGHRPPADEREARKTLQLLEAEYYQQYSFTSCGFFFEDLDRIEPRNDIGFARRAISLVWEALGIDLQSSFLQDLRATRSGRTGLTGFDIYKQLPVVQEGLLPPLKFS